MGYILEQYFTQPPPSAPHLPPKTKSRQSRSDFGTMASTTKQVALITGVSSRLGTSLALAALRANYSVIGTVRSRQRAAKEVEAIEAQGGKVSGAGCDR